MEPSTEENQRLLSIQTAVSCRPSASTRVRLSRCFSFPAFVRQISLEGAPGALFRLSDTKVDTQLSIDIRDGEPPVMATVMKIHTERVLIVGTGSQARTLVEVIKASLPLRYSIVGFVDDRGKSATENPCLPFPVLGSLEDLDRIVCDARPHEIIVALTEQRSRFPTQTLLNACMSGVLVEDGIKAYERLTRKLAIENLTPSALIFSESLRKPRFQCAVRRAVDLSVATLGLILTAPLMALCAVAIKLESKGPVFFVQERAGLEGRTFRLLKFRTMHPNPEPTASKSVWSRDVHSRVTRVGKWLRRFHFDELPQFINVLKGDMALVGPRPEIADNVKVMAEQIPYYSLRNMVRPGVTGWAQIRNGYAVGLEEVSEKVRYDLYYIKHMSLWFDLRILAETIKVVLFDRGTPRS